jgi:uncharacterized protein
MRTRRDCARAAAPGASPDRADIALFVGAVTRRRDASAQPTALPASLATWWDETQGWWQRERRAGQPRHDREHLLNLPVPLTGWSEFEALFELDRAVRGAAGLRVACPLAAAVRAFFAAGGRRCYVVRCGDALAYAETNRPRFFDNPLLHNTPLPVSAVPGGDVLLEVNQLHADRAAARVSILPGLRGTSQAVVSSTKLTGSHWADWQGVQWVFGLNDISMLLLPDLVEAFAVPTVEPPAEIRTGAPLEVFSPCVDAPEEPSTTRLRLLSAPALDALGFQAWRLAIAHALGLLGGVTPTMQRRDVQLIAALPLPIDQVARSLTLQPQADASADIQAWLAPLLDVPADGNDDEGGDLRHHQLQLVWPWLHGQRSEDMAQLIEPPEGAFAGALAAQTLRAGAFRSVALTPAVGVIGSLPKWTERNAQVEMLLAGEIKPRAIHDFLTLCLPHRSGSRGGFEWVSDRTTAQDPVMRIGAVRRLIAQVMRHARRVGDDFVHEPSNEATWFRLKAALDALGERIKRAGALNDSAGDGWQVVCDRRSMMQADIDAGRLIAQINLRPALPIERIVVTLTLRDGGISTLSEAA